MIEVRIADAADETTWAHAIAKCHGNAMQLPAVHRVECEVGDLRPLLFEQDGELVGCALAIEEQHRRARGLLRGPRHLQLPTAPALARPEFGRAVRAALFHFARAQRYERLVVHPTSSDWLVSDDDLARFRTNSITEFVIDLRGGAEAASAAMHKQHRKNVRRAAKAELVVEQDDSIAGLLCLREMQIASSDRANQRSEGFAVRESSFFERLHTHVYGPGHGHVLFARLGDRRIAALAWIEVAESAITVRSGSLAEGYENRAMYLLYDALIQRSLTAGRRELNAGGVPVEAADPEHPQFGLYEFKSGFGGRPITRHGLDIPLEEVTA